MHRGNRWVFRRKKRMLSNKRKKTNGCEKWKTETRGEKQNRKRAKRALRAQAVWELLISGRGNATGQISFLSVCGGSKGVVPAAAETETQSTLFCGLLPLWWWSFSRFFRSHTLYLIWSCWDFLLTKPNSQWWAWLRLGIGEIKDSGGGLCQTGETLSNK